MSLIRWKVGDKGEWQDIPDNATVEFELFKDFVSCHISDGKLIVVSKFGSILAGAITRRGLRIETRG